MTQMFKKAFSSVLESDDWNENMEEFKFWNKFADMPDVRFGCCFQNCILEIHDRGGELVFGSLGFKKNNGQGYHYEWGGGWSLLPTVVSSEPTQAEAELSYWQLAIGISLHLGVR